MTEGFEVTVLESQRRQTSSALSASPCAAGLRRSVHRSHNFNAACSIPTCSKEQLSKSVLQILNRNNYTPLGLIHALYDMMWFETRQIERYSNLLGVSKRPNAGVRGYSGTHTAGLRFTTRTSPGLDLARPRVVDESPRRADLFAQPRAQIGRDFCQQPSEAIFCSGKLPWSALW